MIKLNNYLSFNGNCEEAFTFYKSVFGGELTCISRYNEMPADPNFSIPEADKEKIMHMGLCINKDAVILGADATESCGGLANIGNNISISITTESEEEAKRIFAALSDGGKVTCALELAFWGDWFGSFCDKFGICWMVCYPTNKDKKQECCC